MSKAFSIGAALWVALVLASSACGSVVENAPDGSASETPDAADVVRDATSTGDDATGGGQDASLGCDDGFTGEDCDECTVFVNGQAGDDQNAGLSWNEALATVTAGIVRATERRSQDGVSDCSVWVRRGEYTAGSARTDSFELARGIHLYGGFAGDETSREERDWVANLTILSGDLGGAGENAYHVVRGADGSTLDGFTVTEGLADGPFNQNQNRGGGMYNDGVSPTISNVIFTRNSANSGGAIYNHGPSAPTLLNVTFAENTAGSGGAIYNEGDSAPTLINVVFSGNSATNSAGAMYNHNGDATLTNVVFMNNSCPGFGAGAMESVNSAAPTLTNVTFSGNTSGGQGGALRNASSSTVTLRNVIVWGNEAESLGDEIYNDGESVTLIIQDSIVRGGAPSGSQAVRVVDDDPLFVGAADLRIRSASSPAVDRGDTGVTVDPNFPAVDLAGNPRVVDGLGDGSAEIDIGAYEYQP
jgi:predicted outer membrane repeat protein